MANPEHEVQSDEYDPEAVERTVRLGRAIRFRTVPIFRGGCDGGKGVVAVASVLESSTRSQNEYG